MPDLLWDRAFALEQSGDDEEILAELLDLFKESSAEDLTRIKDGIKENDPETLGNAAHSIKGASASLGIEGIRIVAYEMEKAGRDGDLDKAIGFLVDLESLIGQLDQLK